MDVDDSIAANDDAVDKAAVPAAGVVAVDTFCYQDRCRSTNENRQIDNRIEQ